MRAPFWVAALVIMFVASVVFVVVALYGGFSKMHEFEAAKKCVEICKSEKEKGRDLSRGPCLSENVYPDWVCDVAHWPRESVDNNPENQCSAFREGRAHHFVEVDENCRVIRVV